MTILFIPAVIIGVPAYLVWRFVFKDRDRQPGSWQPKGGQARDRRTKKPETPS